MSPQLRVTGEFVMIWYPAKDGKTHDTTVGRLHRSGNVAAEDLIAAAQGAAGPAVAQHLLACAACGGQAQLYGQLGAALVAQLFRLSCPDTLTIGEYTAGLLTGEQMRQVAAHAVYCPHCRAEIRDCSIILTDADVLIEERGILTAVRRILAQPIRSPQSALAGLRGADADSMTFSAEGVQVRVATQRAGPGGRDAAIIGLLLATPDPASEPRARLFAGDRLLEAQPVDDLGNFLFVGVPAGSYRVELDLGTTVIVLGSLDVA